jgi:hypothetical protein
MFSGHCCLRKGGILALYVRYGLEKDLVIPPPIHMSAMFRDLSDSGVGGKLFENQILAGSGAVSSSFHSLDVSALAKTLSDTKVADTARTEMAHVHAWARRAGDANFVEIARDEWPKAALCTDGKMQDPFQSAQCDMMLVPKDAGETASAALLGFLCQSAAAFATLPVDDSASDFMDVGSDRDVRRFSEIVADVTSGGPLEERSAAAAEPRVALVPRFVAMEITITPDLLRHKLRQLYRAWFLMCRLGAAAPPSPTAAPSTTLPFARPLLLVALNCDRGVAFAECKKVSDFLLRPDASDKALSDTLNRMGRVVVLWAPFRNVFGEIQRIGESTKHLEKGMASMREEMKTDMASMREEMKADTASKADVASMREEMKADMASKADVASMREEMKADMASKADVASMREEMKADVASMREEMKADVASMREEMKADMASMREDMSSMRASVDELMRTLRQHLQNQTVAPAAAAA